MTTSAPCWELLGQSCLLVGLIWTHGSARSHPQCTVTSLLMNWLGWWLTGPQGNWVGGLQVRSGSCLWHRRWEVSNYCWGLREGHPVKPFHLWEMTRQPQKIAGYCTVLTWPRKSKPYITWKFSFMFKSVAGDHRGVQNAVLAKCIQLPLQMSLINWENPVSLNIL